MSCDAECRDGREANLYACNTVKIDNNRFGIPENCGVNLPTVPYVVPHFGMSPDEANSSRLTFSTLGLSPPSADIEFNSLGIVMTCPSGCTISIEGAQTLTIIIESQGYVHEG